MTSSTREISKKFNSMVIGFKPSVLRFLSTAVTGCVVVQDGRLTIHAPETRIIRPGISHTILKGRERESLLTVANDLLDALAISVGEAPLQAVTLENTFRPAQFLGTFIGAAIGFFVGLFVSLVLLVVLKGESLFFPRHLGNHRNHPIHQLNHFRQWRRAWF